MKRWLLALSCLAVVAVGFAAPPVAGQTASADAVTGQGGECDVLLPPPPGFCIDGFSFDVDVRSGPVGENPTGTVNWTDLGPSPAGTFGARTEATCLSVSGSVAIIGVAGVGTGPLGGTPVAGLVRITDGGGPGSARDTFEYAIQTGFPAPPPPGPTDCSTFPGAFPATGEVFRNVEGDLVAVDAPPRLPTSNEQCKNGGWRDFGVFKNQGDCVSFVATGGQNPPDRAP